MSLAASYADQRVFVTGHTGFKGSWLAEWLVALGAEVTGYALDPPTQPSLFDALQPGDRVRHVVADASPVVKSCPPERTNGAEGRPHTALHFI